jgi:hypothetical protein
VVLAEERLASEEAGGLKGTRLALLVATVKERAKNRDH